MRQSSEQVAPTSSRNPARSRCNWFLSEGGSFVETLGDVLAVDQVPSENDYTVLQQEVHDVQAQNRVLQRRLKKAEESAAEALRAHAKMVSTLTETMRENSALVIERDMWKLRTQRAEGVQDQQGALASSALFLPGIDHITEAEARVIRKAVARLHHPDSGGDTERMKAWNAILDRIEYGR